MQNHEAPDLTWQATLLDAIRQRDTDIQKLSGLLVSPFENGLHLYRDSQRAQRRQVLKQAYPVLCQLVGMQCFHALADTYAEETPSLSGDLHLYGASFSDFVCQSPVCAGYPYLAEVARLEWQVHRIYYAADQELLTLHQLISQCGAEIDRMMQVKLKISDCVQIMQFKGNVTEIWLAHQNGDVDGLAWQEYVQYAVVSRPVWRAEVSVISAPEFQALSSIAAGNTLSDALTHLLVVESGSPEQVLQSVQRWLALGVFAAE